VIFFIFAFAFPFIVMPLNPKRLTFIVDDNKDYCELLKRAFADNYPNSRLEFFYSGQALLDRLADLSGKLPDLIMLDLIMPEPDGLATLIKLNESHLLRRIPTIMVSVSDSSEDINNCYQEGVNAYVMKPSRLDDLKYMVNSICRYWLDTSQLPSQRWAY
jgi:CheY-like chemotaxis protein